MSNESVPAKHAVGQVFARICLGIFALPLLAGCTGRSEPADELLIASPHRDEIREEIERAFRGWYQRTAKRDVRPIWLDLGGSSNIKKYILDRLTFGPTAGIDIFFGGGTDPFESLGRDGHLIAYELPDEILSQIPTKIHGVPIYDADFQWYGVVLGTFGILYNREVLSRLGLPEPRTWEDLGSEAYLKDGACWVAAADPRHSSSVHVIYENILQAYGWERGFATLARTAANAREFVRESAAVPRQVQIGEVACAPVVDFFAFSLIAREGRDKIGFALPERHTVITPDAVAIVRGAPNQPVAEAFVRFLMSTEGQNVWMLRRGVPGGPTHYDLGRPSVLPRLYETDSADLAVTVNPFQTQGSLKYDGRLASRRWNVLNDVIGATLIDSQVELRDAWIALQTADNKSELLERLTQPPCDESELIALADSMQQSARLRNDTIGKWMAAARERYRAVAADARRRGPG